MNKVFLILICLLLSSTLFGQTYSFKPKLSISFTSSKGKALLNCCSRKAPDSIKGYWTLTPEDIIKLEMNFKKIYSVQSSVCCSEGTKIENLKSIAFQYIGIWQNSKKRIYINAFPESEAYLYKKQGLNVKNRPVTVCDGGISFWGAVFDLDSLVFTFLAFNGN